MEEVLHGLMLELINHILMSNFVYTIEKRQGLKISCPEEIAFKKGWISSEKVFELSQKFIKSDYGKYLMNLINHQS